MKKTFGIFFLLIILMVNSSVSPILGDIDLVSFEKGMDYGSLLKAIGLVKGDSQGNLNLNQRVTRAEAATLVYRLLGSPKVDETPEVLQVFTDIKADSWALVPVYYLYSHGMMVGKGENLFDPNGLITSQEMAWLLNRYLTVVSQNKVALLEGDQFLQKINDLTSLENPMNIHAALDGKKPIIRGQLFEVLVWTLYQPIGTKGLGQVYLVDQLFQEGTVAMNPINIGKLITNCSYGTEERTFDTKSFLENYLEISSYLTYLENK